LGEGYLGGGDVDGCFLGLKPALATCEAHPASELEHLLDQVELDFGRFRVNAANVGLDTAGALCPDDVGRGIEFKVDPGAAHFQIALCDGDLAREDRFSSVHVDVEPLGVPVLVGLLPLASHRNAEFLHNEVPGMQVPDAIRERMRKAGSGPSARKEGVAIARDMLASVRSRVAGAYIMPPLEKYELALEVVDGFLDT